MKAKSWVFWPGQTVAACERHEQALSQIARAMGMPQPDTRPIEEGTEVLCSNCMNEAVSGAD